VGLLRPALPEGRRTRALLVALCVPVLLCLVGTAGYHFIEGWSLFDSLYMTVISVTTVGFGEVHPLSPAGRGFTILLVMGGVFTLFYAAGALIQAAVSGEMESMMARNRMQRSLQDLHDHIIVCGYGRMGHRVCHEFSSMGMPFVLVDRDPTVLEGFALPHGVVVVGDATSDELLRRVGVERARTLVTLAASDADNLFITMSARLLNERLYIVARAEEEDAEVKLRRAGASRVISPYRIGGQRVAQAVLRPAVMDFVELATRHDSMDLQIEEVAVGAGSALTGRALRDSRLRQDLGVIIVAMRKADGRMLFNPPPDAVIEEGDLLITLGHPSQLDRLEGLAGSLPDRHEGGARGSQGTRPA
jgi:voltage-gated potassium channel